MFGKDVLKTLRRFLGKILIIMLITYPLSLILGLIEVINPVVESIIDLPSIYAILMYLS